MELLQNLLVVAGQVITLFLMMGVGFVLAKLGRLTDAGLSQISFLLLYVVTPCIIIKSFQHERNPQLLADMGWGALANVGYYVVLALLVIPLFRRQGPDTRAPLQFGVVYANTGFMGLPLVQAVLGDEATIFCVICMGIFNLAQWTHGVSIMGGRGAMTVKKAVLNPGVIGVAAGFLLFITGFPMPSVVGGAVGFLAELNTPLAMVVIGGQMASADLKATFTQRRLYTAVGLRLVAAPLLTALVLAPFRLNPLLYCTLVIIAATPMAGNTSILAQKFERDTATAAQLVTLSTLLSVLTLPVFAVLAQALSG